MPINECCCESVINYFRQLFCVSQLLNLFSQSTPSTEEHEAQYVAGGSTGTSLASVSENNNGSTTASQSSRFGISNKCDHGNLRGTEGEYAKERSANTASGSDTLAASAAGNDETIAPAITDEASPTVKERMSNYLNWRNVALPSKPSRSWYYRPAQATTASPIEKRNTYPQRTETSRRTQLTQRFWQLLTSHSSESRVSRRREQSRLAAATCGEGGQDVTILRGYRDIIPMLRQERAKVSKYIPTEGMLKKRGDSEMDSQSSSSSDESPPWLPESEFCNLCPQVDSMRKYSTEEEHPSDKSVDQGPTHPQLSTGIKDREKCVTTGGSSNSAGDHQSCPSPREEEVAGSGSLGVLPALVLGRDGARFIWRPRDQEASTGGGGGGEQGARATSPADWQDAPAGPPTPVSRGLRGRLPLSTRDPRSLSRATRRRQHRLSHTVLPYPLVRGFSNSSSVGGYITSRHCIHCQNRRVVTQRGTGISQHPGGASGQKATSSTSSSEELER